MEKTKEQVERRVIVVDIQVGEKYTLPDNHDAAFLMDGTAERVRKKLKKNNGKPLYKKYLVFNYSEEIYNELTKNGIKDGRLYDAFKMRYDRLFSSLYC